jgi:outer membrane biosynthesis protein TonB
MKATGIVSTAVLSLLLGTAALAYAQQDQQDKPAPRDEKAQKDKPAKEKEKTAQQQDKNNTNQRERNAQQQNSNTKQEEKSAQQQDRNNKQEEKNAQQQNQNNKQEEKNTQQSQRAGNGRGRIPEDRFRASFGREHSFRVNQSDYSRDRRFQYGGYSFLFVDAWPSNWLYTQDVFVVEINGVYYLCNPMYPGVNITLNIVE